MAGHSDFVTTQKYIALAGVVFGDEVRRLSEWYAEAGTKNRTKWAATSPEPTQEARLRPVGARSS
jgi:hypothetical protein